MKSTNQLPNQNLINSRMLVLILLLTVLSIGSVLAQNEINIGKAHLISSEILGEDREIQIFLPEGYEDSDKQYPTLYVLDGQWYFEIAVALQYGAIRSRLYPEMIVVGLKMQRPRRGELLLSQNEQFASFFEDELIPYMDRSYRTTTDRVLFGWEEGGSFACNMILSDKELFKAAIASNGGYLDQGMLKGFSKSDISEEKYLYIANSSKDIYSIDESENVKTELENYSPDNLTWKYDRFDDEVHASLAYLSMYYGLKFYYHNYGSLVFGSVQDFHEQGGVEYLANYFAARGERFGFPKDIDNSTKNSLIWLAWNRDDFDSFKLFMTEFADVLSTQRYASAYWQNKLGEFYMRHEDYENALTYFNRGITTYVNDTQLAEMHHNRGIIHKSLGNFKLAKADLKSAVKIAKSTNDEQLNSYQEELVNLKK